MESTSERAAAIAIARNRAVKAEDQQDDQSFGPARCERCGQPLEPGPFSGDPDYSCGDCLGGHAPGEIMEAWGK